jgi:hypothetical protein
MTAPAHIRSALAEAPLLNVTIPALGMWIRSPTAGRKTLVVDPDLSQPELSAQRCIDREPFVIARVIGLVRPFQL